MNQTIRREMNKKYYEMNKEKKKERQKEYDLNTIRSQFQISQYSDWYRISFNQIRNDGDIVSSFLPLSNFLCRAIFGEFSSFVRPLVLLCIHSF